MSGMLPLPIGWPVSLRCRGVHSGEPRMSAFLSGTAVPSQRTRRTGKCSRRTDEAAVCRRGRRAVQVWAEVSLDEVDPGQVEGTSLRIVKYPHPALRAVNQEIEVFDDELAKLAREMLKVMYASRGVGLAAPQVGKNLRLLVFNPEGNEKAWLQEVVLVNPRIVSSSSKLDIEAEGCLSFPGMSGEVKRSQWIKVEAQTLKGKPFKTKYVDWKARIFQHEYDHLDGKLYIDHLSNEGRDKVQPVLDELVSGFDGEKAL